MVTPQPQPADTTMTTATTTIAKLININDRINDIGLFYFERNFLLIVIF